MVHNTSLVMEEMIFNHFMSMGAFYCHGNQTKRQIGKCLAILNCPYTRNIPPRDKSLQRLWRSCRFKMLTDGRTTRRRTKKYAKNVRVSSAFKGLLNRGIRKHSNQRLSCLSIALQYLRIQNKTKDKIKMSSAAVAISTLAKAHGNPQHCRTLI